MTAGLPTSWRNANTWGIDRYFTGKPCKRGHIASRYANNGCCLVCAAEKLRQRRATPHSMALRAQKRDERWAKQQAFAGKEITRRGWKWIAGQYTGQKSRYLVECAEGHRFDISFWRLKQTDNDCKKCTSERLMLPADRFEERVRQRGGTIIKVIDKWQGTKSVVRLRCANGHIWESTVHSIYRANSWCTVCTSHIGERIMRDILEATFGQPFLRLRPEWLASPTGRLMELDAYNEGLRLAAEYNGPRHSKPSQAARDALKHVLCRERGIRLLSIPSVNPFPPENVAVAIELALRERGIEDDVILPEIDFTKSELAELQEHAINKGGELLSPVYLGADKKHEWKCEDPSHPSWRQTPNSVVRSNRSRPNGTWCPYCAGVVPLGFDFLRKFGQQNGLMLLSEQYVTNSTRYQWRCVAFDHEFFHNYTNFDRAIRAGKPACLICRKATSLRGNPRPVICLDTEEVFSSVTIAAKEKNCQGSHITSVCTGRRHSAGGFKWAYFAPPRIKG